MGDWRKRGFFELLGMKSAGGGTGWKSVATAAVMAGILSGCGLFSGGETDKTAGWSAQKLYSEAQDHLNGRDWGEAIKMLDTLQARYPFGRYGQQAQMELAYAQWKNGDPELALSAADKFIKQYPNHPNVDYLYYLKGVINFNDDLGFLSAVTRQDLTERDPKALRESFDAFRELINRFPESKYAADATARMKYLVTALASHEVHVARYYLRRGAYVASVNRAQNVIREYRQSPSLEEALQIMAKSYDGLGLTALRDDTLRVIQINYPKSAAADSNKSSWWRFW